MYHPKEYVEQANLFFESYNPKYYTICPSSKMKGLKLKPDRKCRFCGLSEPNTSFKETAHLIPEFLGNKYLISEFECDHCNKIFAQYENDFANFLGPILSLQGINGKVKDKKFKNPDKNVVIQKEKIWGDKDYLTISRENVEDTSFEIDREKGKGSIRFIKHSYTPINVYKSLVKLALSCLPEEEVGFYELTKKFILTPQLNDMIKGIQRVFVSQLPLGYGYNSPHTIIYEKKDSSLEIPTHVFIIYFGNLIYQIQIPFHKNDLKFYDGRILNIKICPPLLPDEKFVSNNNIQTRILELEGLDKIKGEVEVFSYQLNVNDLDKSVVYNPTTKEYTNDLSIFGGTKRIVLVDDGTQIKLTDE